MSKKVIDVSSHQDVSVVQNTDAEGVIIKTTEGTGYVNPLADAQYQAAKKRGKLLGIYHYARGGDPIKEADFFYNNSKNYFGEAIPALDWEEYTNAAWSNVSWGLKFVNRIHELSGVWCLLYTGMDGAKQNAKLVPISGLWLAAYPDDRQNWTAPNFTYSTAPWKSLTGWQYTSGGGALDRSIFYLDAAGWKKIAAGDKKATEPSKPSTPSTPAYSTAGKSLEQMANDVLNKKVGTGPARTKALGKFYTGVQAIVNHKLKTGSISLTNTILANETKKDVYGKGDTRKKLLGSYYNGVQAVINKTAVVYHTVKPGETVSGIASAYKTSSANIVKLNSLKNANLIYAGQRLRVK
ncbi:glycoside hydrolase family 25 [Lapidilactobacillus dextrinicus DSM 20335]|uniref:Glycoside hydrolase family 25 n=1 Tax=Lapidilactobacillus dextrinicus DSM 20335 TaxID=1423738 RepID=A0A0R2BU07_9LACO|nr:GH25 family lysozyme [Lapidilactobacillus dextrinicus]KRM79462.1 glycoside hydrolase family 25 [Lapidilactobacillus dextrinicus DSM 20335]QFG46703.1 LysM peptidoglycan-binding domain-containing protein [Lapidilactobacillus dextrinicus]